MRAEPHSVEFGAYVRGIRANRLSDPSVVAEIRTGLNRYGVLVFQGLTTDEEIFAELARSLGAPVRHDFVASTGSDFVHEIRKEPWHSHNFGGTWHSDGSYLTRPPRTIALQAVETPAHGGDTLWACQVAAAAALPTDLMSSLLNVHAQHSASSVFDAFPETGRAAAALTARHPFVRWLEDRQCLALFHSGPCLGSIEGWGDGDSGQLLKQLFEVATAARTFRHAWRPGDVVLWDNRATLHKAMNDYPGELRRMRRAMIEPEAPRAAPHHVADIAD